MIIKFFHSKIAIAIGILLLSLTIVSAVFHIYADSRVPLDRKFLGEFIGKEYISPSGNAVVRLAVSKRISAYNFYCAMFYKGNDWPGYVEIAPLTLTIQKGRKTREVLDEATVIWNSNETAVKMIYDDKIIGICNELPADEPSFAQTREGQNYYSEFFEKYALAALIVDEILLIVSSVWITLVIVVRKYFGLLKQYKF